LRVKEEKRREEKRREEKRKGTKEGRNVEKRLTLRY